MSRSSKEAESILNKFGLLTEATAQHLLDGIENGTVTLNGGLTAPDAMEAVRVAAVTSRHLSPDHYASNTDKVMPFNHSLADNLAVYQAIAAEVGTQEFQQHMANQWQANIDSLAKGLEATGVSPQEAAQAAAAHMAKGTTQITPEGKVVVTGTLDKTQYLQKRKELSHLEDGHPDVVALQAAYTEGRVAPTPTAQPATEQTGAPSTTPVSSTQATGKGGATRVSSVMTANSGRGVHRAGIRPDAGAGGH